MADERLDLTENVVTDVINGLPKTMTTDQFNKAIGKVSDMARLSQEVIQEVLNEFPGLTLEADHDKVVELASIKIEERLVALENREEAVVESDEKAD